VDTTLSHLPASQSISPRSSLILSSHLYGLDSLRVIRAFPIKCYAIFRQSILATTLTVFFPLPMTLQPFGAWPFFSFLIVHTVGRTPWTADQPVARPLPTDRTTQTQYKRKKTSMPGVGFEPKTSVFERAKTVHILDSAPTVIGY
jgi:hypothetical protein